MLSDLDALTSLCQQSTDFCFGWSEVVKMSYPLGGYSMVIDGIKNEDKNPSKFTCVS